MVTTRAALEQRGFLGFVPFSALSRAGLPDTPGVYAVLRESLDPPAFLESSAACARPGRRGGPDRLATEPVSALATNWVDAVEVVYIGKADARKHGGGLETRLKEYLLHGTGKRPKHWGGRYIWQLADHEELLVAWLETAGDAASVESAMLKEFVRKTGRLPFANLRH